MIQPDVNNGQVQWFLTTEPREFDKFSNISRKLSNRDSLRSLNNTNRDVKPSRKSHEFLPSMLILEEPEEDVYKTIIPSKE